MPLISASLRYLSLSLERPELQEPVSLMDRVSPWASLPEKCGFIMLGLGQTKCQMIFLYGLVSWFRNSDQLMVWHGMRLTTHEEELQCQVQQMRWCGGGSSSKETAGIFCDRLISLAGVHGIQWPLFGAAHSFWVLLPNRIAGTRSWRAWQTLRPQGAPSDPWKGCCECFGSHLIVTKTHCRSHKT